MVSARTILATLGVVQLLVRSVCVCVRACMQCLRVSVCLGVVQLLVRSVWFAVASAFAGGVIKGSSVTFVLLRVYGVALPERCNIINTYIKINIIKINI
jgi:hypothetical protein